MKVALFRSPNRIEVLHRDIPTPKDNEVLIKVGYAGICGTDKKIFDGDIPCAPVVLGHEFSGNAVAIGSKVKNIKLGNHYSVQPNISCGVCDICRKGIPHLCKDKISHGIQVDGGFAEYCAVDSTLLFPVKNLTHIESALIEPIACCLRGIEMCNLSIGQDVLIIGGGFIGLIFVQLARLCGSEVHLVTRTEKKRELATMFGATATYETISDLNKDFGVVIEAVGKPDTIGNAFNVAGRGGRILLFGVTHNEVTLRPYEIFNKELKIFGLRSNGNNHFDAIQVLSKLNTQSLVSHVVGLDDAEAGLKVVGQSGCIKAVVRLMS